MSDQDDDVGAHPEFDDDEFAHAAAPGSPKEEKQKQYKLKGCTMKVVSCGKRQKTDEHMIIDLEFTFPQQAAKFVELPYTPEGMKNALMHCNNALDTFVFLEDCNYKDNKNAFGELIHQEIERYKQKQGGQGGSRKPKIIATKPCVKKIGQNFYFISSDIYLLSGEVKKLTEKDIQELPVLISWDGPLTDFQTNPKECMTLLVRILRLFNLMQNRKFVSFPLAVFVAHIAGCLYQHIVREQGNYASQMFISGVVHGTGKSLMRSLMMLIVFGELRPPTRILTEHTFYEMLDSGDSIYVNEFVLKSPPRRNEVDAKFLSFAVQTLWEMSEKKSKGRVYQPKGVMHVDANIVPKELEPYMNQATLSKLFFNHTGPIPLKHSERVKIIDELKIVAEKLHQFLPDLYSMGVNLIVPVASDIESAHIDHLLKTAGDPREAQRIVIYDRVYRYIKKGIKDYNLEKPILFETDDIDRTSLLYCNVEEEDYVKYEELTQEVVEICENNLMSDLVEMALARGTYKVDVDNEIFPSRLAKDLKKLITPSHTFFKGSKNKKRVIMLNEAFLSEETAKKLKDLTCRYSLWSRPIAVKEEYQMMTYGNKFYSNVETNRKDDELGVTDSHSNLEEGVHQSSSQKRKLQKTKPGKQPTLSSLADKDVEDCRQKFQELSSKSDEDDENSSPRKKFQTFQEDVEETSTSDKEKYKPSTSKPSSKDVNEKPSQFRCAKPSCRDFDKPFKSESELKRHEGMVPEHKDEAPTERSVRIRKPAIRYSPSDPGKSHGTNTTRGSRNPRL